MITSNVCPSDATTLTGAKCTCQEDDPIMLTFGTVTVGRHLGRQPGMTKRMTVVLQSTAEYL